MLTTTPTVALSQAAQDEIELLRLVIQSAHAALSVGHVADAQDILRRTMEGRGPEAAE